MVDGGGLARGHERQRLRVELLGLLEVLGLDRLVPYSCVCVRSRKARKRVGFRTKLVCHLFMLVHHNY